MGAWGASALDRLAESHVVAEHASHSGGELTVHEFDAVALVCIKTEQQASGALLRQEWDTQSRRKRLIVAGTSTPGARTRGPVSSCWRLVI